MYISGDVISCCIDCDIGSISFYRNGVDLGEAFGEIRIGPLYSYYPAVSLSMGENLRANFGATPLRYLIEGYQPLQVRTECSEISAIAENGYKMVILTDMNFIFHNNNLDNMRNCSDKWPICNQNSLEKKRISKILIDC